MAKLGEDFGRTPFGTAAIEAAAARNAEPLYVVRLWDGFDGEWMDVSDGLPKSEAEKLSGDKNEARTGSGAGNRDGHYGEIDYYKAFPADTQMRGISKERRGGA